ncbi:MAG: HAD family hydrolase [Rhodoglobus sp.]
MSNDAPKPPSERPILAFFDVDNTLMKGASVYYVGREAFRRGLISWRDIALFAWHQFRFLAVGENRSHLTTAKDRALGLASGYTETALTALAEDIYERVFAPKLWPETVALTQEHLDKGHEVWLITATPQLVAQVIADRLGLTGALGTRVQALDGVFTGVLDGHVLHGVEKAKLATAFAGDLNADLADCWAYSDSSNDIPLLTAVGNRVVVNPDAQLLSHANTHAWTVLPLKRSSIRAAQKRVKKNARSVRRNTPK